MRCRSCVLVVAPMVGLTACAPDTDAPAGWVDEIVIPMRPVTEGTISGAAEVDDSEAVPRVRIDTTLTLGVGDGYPTSFTTAMPQYLFADCGMLEGEITIHDLSGGNEAISAARSDTGAALTVHTVGTADLSLPAEITLTEPNACDLPVGTPIALDVRVAVRAVQPVAITFDRPFGCETDVPLVAPSAIAGLEVAIVDETGSRRHAANAASDAQVTLRLRGSFDAAHSEPASLADWIAPPVPGEVEVVPPSGAPLHVDVVDATVITAVEVEFQLAGVKGPTTLEPDATHGEDGWGLTQNRLEARVHEVRVGDFALCSSPDPSWFQLESLTPAICEIVPREPSDDESFLFYGAPAGQAARLKQDGTCSLILRAPAFAPSAGFPLSLSGTFHNVRDFWDW